MNKQPPGGTGSARRLLAGVLAAALALVSALPAKAVTDDEFLGAVRALGAKSFADKRVAIASLAGTGHERATIVLQAMLDGDLRVRKADGLVALATKAGRGYAMRDAATGADLGESGRRDSKKVRINNRLRAVLRDTMAKLRLRDPDPEVRLAAATALARAGDADSLALVREALAQEGDTRVREALGVGIAMAEATNGTAGKRIEAIAVLRESLAPEVRALLDRIAADAAIESAVSTAANEALHYVDGRLWRYQQVENLFFGLSLGSVLLLAAVGLAITFGVMGVINMAHGEMVMLGAYTTYVIQQLMPDAVGASILLAIPAAFAVAGIAGIAVERGVLRFLYGRPLETLLATFGVSLILQQTVRTVFSPLNRAVSSPEWMSGLLVINPALSITYNRLYIIAFSLIVLAALAALMARTTFGLKVRAVTQNREMARAMGIRTGRIDMLTFGLGSGIAGMAGVALSQITNVGPNMGQGYIIDSFMVVVFGGVGNLLGTFVGAMTLGVANKFLEPVSGAVLAKILVLVFIILFIQRRPRGLFAQTGRAVE